MTTTKAKQENRKHDSKGSGDLGQKATTVVKKVETPYETLITSLIVINSYKLRTLMLWLSIRTIKKRFLSSLF